MKQKRMRRQDRESIDRQLVDLERRLARDMNNRLRNVQNTSLEDPTELLDMASDGELDYMAALSAEAGSSTIDEIERAREKLRNGSYGVCETCGDHIAKRRMKVRPFASLCIRCKESQERLGYVPGPSEVSVRGDYATVDLTGREDDGLEGSLEDVFRDVEDVGIY